MQTLLIFFNVSGVILIVLSLPLLAGKIKPNPFYGFRIEQTLKNPVSWYVTNQYFACWQLMVGFVVVLTSLSLFFWPGLSVDVYALACLAVIMLAFGVAMVKSITFMKGHDQRV